MADKEEAHAHLVGALRRLHDVIDVQRALSAASRLCREQLEEIELENRYNDGNAHLEKVLPCSVLSTLISMI
jgi:hypothetical protein